VPQLHRSTRSLAWITSTVLAAMVAVSMLVASPVRAATAAPVANFTAASTGVVGQPTTFDASSSTGDIVSYKWELVGSDVAFTGKSASWTWTSAGTKTPKLTVTDSLGRTASATQSYNVSAGTAAAAPASSSAQSGTGALPSGLTVGIVPKVGHPTSEYFAYVNGTPPAGRSIKVGTDLGIPALRADLGTGDAPSGGLWRNQVGGAKKVDGGTYNFRLGEVAYNGVRIKLGPNTNTSCGGFLAMFNWTSFIGGQGSGPFQLM
jgi:hypothetical protein